MAHITRSRKERLSQHQSACAYFARNARKKTQKTQREIRFFWVFVAFRMRLDEAKKPTCAKQGTQSGFRGIQNAVKTYLCLADPIKALTGKNNITFSCRT
jgi:hypothetical protein